MGFVIVLAVQNDNPITRERDSQKMTANDTLCFLKLILFPNSNPFYYGAGQHINHELLEQSKYDSPRPRDIVRHRRCNHRAHRSKDMDTGSPKKSSNI